MIFKNLKEKCEYYRSLTDYKLLPNGYTIVMLDGRSFSKKIKNKFKQPFDDTFIDIMNKTAQYLCKNVSGVVLAYTQSDEISLIIKDDNESEPFFGNRLCKMQSIIASLATGKFNQLMTMIELADHKNEDVFDVVQNMKLYEFDCKVWNVPNKNDAFAWLIWRQNDCIRNSKQQFCQTYASHNELKGKNTDEQVDFTIEKYQRDWNEIDNDKKFGRIIIKRKRLFNNIDLGITYDRTVWDADDAKSFNDETYRENLLSTYF